MSKKNTYKRINFMPENKRFLIKSKKYNVLKLKYLNISRLL